MKYLLLLLAVASTPTLAFDTNACHALCLKMAHSNIFKAYYYERTGKNYPIITRDEAYAECGYLCLTPGVRDNSYASIKSATQDCIKAKGSL